MSNFRVSSLQSKDTKDTTVFSIRKRKMRNHVLMLVRPLGSTLRRGNRPARAALETHLTAKRRAPCPLIAFNRDIDPKNNGNSFFHGEIVFLRRFLPRARLRTAPYQWSKVPAYKTDEDALPRARRAIYLNSRLRSCRSSFFRDTRPGGHVFLAERTFHKGRESSWRNARRKGRRLRRGGTFLRRGVVARVPFAEGSSAVGISESKFRKSAEGRRNVLIQRRD